MKTIILCLLPLLASTLLGLVPASASEEPANDASASSQFEQNRQSSDEFKSLDAELTRIYEEQLAKQSSPALREALIESQKAWKNFRQADGHYESLLGADGSARIFYVNRRMSYLTRQRIYQLRTPFTAGWVPTGDQTR